MLKLIRGSMSNKKKEKQVWQKIRRKAPKVPDITCPAIDDIISRLNTLQDNRKELTAYQVKVLTNKLERLRSANEKLRESGHYWHDACQNIIKEFFTFGKYKKWKLL